MGDRKLVHYRCQRLCVYALSPFSRVWLFAAHGLQPARLLCLWETPGENTGVSHLALLQGIFPTQGWNPHLFCLLHWQAGSFTTDASLEASVVSD